MHMRVFSSKYFTILNMQDIDLFEVNEAFAPQCIAVAKEVGIPLDKYDIIALLIMYQNCETSKLSFITMQSSYQ